MYENKVLVIVAARTNQSQEKCQAWTGELLQKIRETSQHPPSYLNDPNRTLLYFHSKYNETGTNLARSAAEFRFRSLLRQWKHLLATTLKPQDLLVSPLEWMQQHPWAKTLIEQERQKKAEPHRELERLIGEASAESEGGIYPCPQCHSKKYVTSRDEQRRSCDEGMTTVNICSQCNKKWILK